MSRDEIVRVTISNLIARNIDSWYVADKSRIMDEIIKLIPQHTTVGMGNSQTLQQINASEVLSKRGNLVYDKNWAANPEESRSFKKKALLADWYIAGTNAISSEGHIVSIDHSGNRVAAMIYGPEHVIIVAGVNKITATLAAAIERARSHAAHLNAQKAGMNPPCVELGKCIDCRSKERVCNNLVIIEGQHSPGRMTVLIVGEEMGF